ncbi:hypothetical protein BASA81_013128 [Batrachochytrium salamandrivorans]|nr:hypothetical protein BASA81_013128 [Batrachochytrium salamandrivorans]
MANSDISVSSVDHRQEPSLSPSTTFSIYGLAAVSITYLRSILAPIPGPPDGTCLQDRPPYHKIRCSISHKRSPKTDNATSSSASSAKASKLTGVFGKTTDIDRPDQPRPTAPPPPTITQILAVNVANISNKRPAIRHIVRNTRLWAISETCITSSKFRFTVPGFDVIQHPATDLDAEELP